MSTYTDLKNRIKENIVVGYAPCDRITNQKVRFYNEENEYWGSFTGYLSSSNISLQRGTITDVSVYNSTIIDSVLKTAEGRRIDMGALADELDELSNVVIPDIRNEISETKEELSADYTDKISCERDERVKCDGFLHMALNKECMDRAIGDKETRKYADIKRHHDIHAIPIAGKMPFASKEFAVNSLLDYDIPDAFVTDAESRALVGKVEKYNSLDQTLEFVPYVDADAKYTAILGTQAYKFTNISGTSESHICFDPTYRLTYTRNGTGEQPVTNQHFELSPVADGVRRVMFNGKTIGIVTDAHQSPIVSGMVCITTQDSPLSVFNDGQSHEFSANVPIEFNYGADELVFNPFRQHFECRTGIKYRHYEDLIDGDERWAKIYQDTVSPFETGMPSAFAVSFIPAGEIKQKDYLLTQSDNYRTVINPVDHQSVMLSGKTVLYRKEYLNYGYFVNLNVAGDIRTAEMVIGGYNTVMRDMFNYDLSVDMTGVFDMPELNRVYTLQRRFDKWSCLSTINDTKVSIDFICKSMLKVRVSSGLIDELTGFVNLDSEHVFIDNSIIYKKSQEIDFERFVYEKSDRIAPPPYNAEVGPEFDPEKRIYVFNCETTYEYSENQYDTDEILITVPDKPEGLTRSREFMFIVKPLSDHSEQATVRFVKPNGKDVKFFEDLPPEVIVKTNMVTTIDLREVTPDRFMVLGGGSGSHDPEIADLYRRIATETTKREAGDLSILTQLNAVSTFLSSEIAKIPGGGSQSISAISSDLYRLSGEVNTVSVKITGDYKTSDQTLSNDLTGIVNNVSTILSGKINEISGSGSAGSISSISVISSDLYKLSNEVNVVSTKIVTDYKTSDQTLSNGLTGIVNNVSTFLSSEIAKIPGSGQSISAISSDLYRLSNEVNVVSTFLSSEIAKIPGGSQSISAISSDLYRLSGEVNVVSTKIITDYKTSDQTLSNDLTGIVNNVSVALENQHTELSNDLTGLINTVSVSTFDIAKEYTDDRVSDLIKFSLDGSAGETGWNSHELSVCKLTNSLYDQLVITEAVNEHTLYVISDDFLDARGQTILNLSASDDESAAATVGQVKNVLDVIDAKIRESPAIMSLLDTEQMTESLDSVDIMTTVSALVEFVKIFKK